MAWRGGLAGGDVDEPPLDRIGARRTIYAPRAEGVNRRCQVSRLTIRAGLESCEKSPIQAVGVLEGNTAAAMAAAIAAGWST